MQYAPPPLFKQGAPARVRVAVYIFIAIVMLMVDSRLHALVEVRQAIGFVLYPFQKAAMLPRDALYAAGDYFASLASLQEEVGELRKRELENAQMLQQAEQLATENAHLRQLLRLNERLPVKSLPAEVLYDARTSYARRVILNKGSTDGVILGQPVIDENGVIGQVTRVFLHTAEVTLLTDKDQAIPVQAARTGIRSIAYGRGQAGYLELRFMEANADVQPGDVLVTSGIDGLYPPGLAVGKVMDISDRGSGTFNHILCRPLAGLDKSRQVLVLMPRAVIEPPPPEEDEEPSGKARRQADVAAARKKAGIK
ncbi:MAG: rod shape-determining protein MreC [Alistipes senegalensis]|nr:rod shape-determining protein MreC [Oxalobacter formigenes]MCM1281378.1 rod shape-determining protein MreC [Alistipes senegalensis]